METLPIARGTVLLASRASYFLLFGAVSLGLGCVAGFTAFGLPWSLGLVPLGMLSLFWGSWLRRRFGPLQAIRFCFPGESAFWLGPWELGVEVLPRRRFAFQRLRCIMAFHDEKSAEPMGDGLRLQGMEEHEVNRFFEARQWRLVDLLCPPFEAMEEGEFASLSVLVCWEGGHVFERFRLPERSGGIWEDQRLP